jgi:hypothetical protein
MGSPAVRIDHQAALKGSLVIDPLVWLRLRVKNQDFISDVHHSFVVEGRATKSHKTLMYK